MFVVTTPKTSILKPMLKMPIPKAKTYGSWSWILNPSSKGFGFVVARKLFDYDSLDFRQQFFIRMEPVTHGNGK